MSFRLFFGRSSAPPGQLTGRSATVHAGVLTPAIEVALTGQQVAASQGTLVGEAFFATDTFTAANNTLITARPADSGQDWFVGDGTSGTLTPWIQSNRATARNSEFAHFMVLESTGASVNQFCRASIFINNDTATNAASNAMHYGVGVRCTESAGDYSGYYFGYDTSSIHQLALMAFDPVRGNVTLWTDDASGYSPSTGQTHTFELQARTVGGDVELKGYINGVEYVSITDTDPTSLQLNNDQIGFLVDNAGDATAYGRFDTIWAGELAAASGSVTLTGQAATAAHGAMVPLLSIPLTGFSVTASHGALTPDLGSAVSLSGFSMTAAQGALVPEISLALAGFASTASGGTMVPALAIPMTGQVASAVIGAMTPAIATGLTGQAATAAIGSPTATLDVVLAGQAGTAAHGGMGVTLTIPVQGQFVTAAFGTLSASGAGEVALTGFSMVSALGSLSVRVSVELAGHALVVETEAFVFPLQDSPHPSDYDVFSNATNSAALALVVPITREMFAVVDAAVAPPAASTVNVEELFSSVPVSTDKFVVH